MTKSSTLSKDLLLVELLFAFVPISLLLMLGTLVISMSFVVALFATPEQLGEPGFTVFIPVGLKIIGGYIGLITVYHVGESIIRGAEVTDVWPSRLGAIIGAISLIAYLDPITLLQRPVSSFEKSDVVVIVILLMPLVASVHLCHVSRLFYRK